MNSSGSSFKGPKGLVYIEEKNKFYEYALKMLKEAERISIFPIMTSVNESQLSILYICTKDEVFIFDILRFSNGLPNELQDVVISNKCKVVYGEEETYKNLGIPRTMLIPSTYDLLHLAHIVLFGLQLSDDEHLISSNNQINTLQAEIDWSVRPFSNNIHFEVGILIYSMLTTFDKLKTLLEQHTIL